MSPMDYLFRWRMHIARRALQRPDSVILNVAEQVGYHSEAAFGAAFKRMFGIAPRRYSASKLTDGHRLDVGNGLSENLF